MRQAGITLKQLWREQNFDPNDNQKEAILHTDGPLFLPAGPGSGKTRVLLWRTLNLIVFHGVKPEEIFLSTFTEKAALQLKEGLRAFLGMATSLTNTPYDLSKMYVGTVHSLCQKLIADRRFYPHRERGKIPIILDELGQYFHLSNRRRWQEFTRAAGLGEAPEQQINSLFKENGKPSASRYVALANCLALFNRLSEECRDPQWDKNQTENAGLKPLLEMYDHYRHSLDSNGIPQTDLSLLQQKAYLVLSEFEGAVDVFKHVIIDEYQDTNTVQELIFFHLAARSKNICVVGDDDQALYRFRGATVENFVEFPQRCRDRFGVLPRILPLVTNYRSRKQIVDFYTKFMTLCDWRRPDNPAQSFRVGGKQIRSHSNDNSIAVVASTPAKPEDACQEIVGLVRRLLKEGKVQNENQIAFLYPSLKYIINRATALDWNLLDLFYQLCGFEHFKAMFDLAERGRDEGPICNLALISKYLSRFNDEYVSILTAELLEKDGFERLFFCFYLYALFRRGESEYEDADDPFPKGRIPFITIHQSKGLEFPVVILANPRKDDHGPPAVEKLVHPFLNRKGEPLDRIAEFDAMRMFYVALSRAKNLVVIAHFKGQGQRMNAPFKELLEDDFPRIPALDWETLPAAQLDDVELPKNYSYTGDFLLYLQCPRQYMVYRKYGFAPSRSLTMMFGNLVHRTLDDLHQYLISLKNFKMTEK
jgi:superfamily I DNA/RNA helicase